MGPRSVVRTPVLSRRSPWDVRHVPGHSVERGLRPHGSAKTSLPTPGGTPSVATIGSGGAPSRALDVVDVTKGMSHALTAHGVDTTVTELAEPGTAHRSLTLADLTTLVDHVLALAAG